MRMTGTTWGQCKDDRDHMGTTKLLKMPFERIEIIEFCLKIWDP